MFYSPELLSIKSDSGFALIWLAATLGPRSNHKKLSKRDVNNVNVIKSCRLISSPPEPLSLRLSSTLLVGLTRIYGEQCHQQWNEAQNIVHKHQKQIPSPSDNTNMKNITNPSHTSRVNQASITLDICVPSTNSTNTTTTLLSNDFTTKTLDELLDSVMLAGNDYLTIKEQQSPLNSTGNTISPHQQQQHHPSTLTPELARRGTLGSGGTGKSSDIDILRQNILNTTTTPISPFNILNNSPFNTPTDRSLIDDYNNNNLNNLHSGPASIASLLSVPGFMDGMMTDDDIETATIINDEFQTLKKVVKKKPKARRRIFDEERIILEKEELLFSNNIEDEPFALINVEVLRMNQLEEDDYLLVCKKATKRKYNQNSHQDYNHDIYFNTSGEVNNSNTNNTNSNEEEEENSAREELFSSFYDLRDVEHGGDHVYKPSYEMIKTMNTPFDVIVEKVGYCRRGAVSTFTWVLNELSMGCLRCSTWEKMIYLSKIE